MPHVQHPPHLEVCCRRKKPGLRPQHLAGLGLIAKISGGALQGGQENSSAIVLQPGRLQCRNALGDTGTAGSCALLAQVLHLVTTALCVAELQELPKAAKVSLGYWVCPCSHCKMSTYCRAALCRLRFPACYMLCQSPRRLSQAKPQYWSSEAAQTQPWLLQ